MPKQTVISPYGRTVLARQVRSCPSYGYKGGWNLNCPDQLALVTQVHRIAEGKETVPGVDDWEPVTTETARD